MFKIIGLIFLIFLAALVLSFTSLNAHSVQINYYFGSTELPLAMAMVISIVAGILFGFFSSLGIVLRLKRENLRLKKSARLAEQELEQIRLLPPQDK